jgi:hypothetical protein
MAIAERVIVYPGSQAASSGCTYLPMFWQPALVFEADVEKLTMGL